MPQTLAGMPSNNRIYYQTMLLDRLTRKLRFKQLGKLSLNMPKRQGDTADWMRYSEIHVTDPNDYLTPETVVGSEQAIVSQVVQATVKQYTNYTVVGDKLEYVSRSPVLEDISEILGDHAAELLDTIIKVELDTTLPIQYANGKASLATTGAGDIMTVKEGFKASVGLGMDDVGPHEQGAYICVVSPAGKGDILNDTNKGGFVDVKQYTDPKMILKGEIGECYGVRYLESTNLTSTTTGTLDSARVWNNILLGEGCFGVARLGRENFEMNIKSSGPQSTNDPNNQINTVGYKFLGFVAKYLGGSGNGTSDRGRVIKAGSAFENA